MRRRTRALIEQAVTFAVLLPGIAVLMFFFVRSVA